MQLAGFFVVLKFQHTLHPAGVGDDGKHVVVNIHGIMEKLTAGEDGPASYNGEELSPEAAELFRDELEIALKRLKLINKDKYTPKKYKK